MSLLLDRCRQLIATQERLERLEMAARTEWCVTLIWRDHAIVQRRVRELSAEVLQLAELERCAEELAERHRPERENLTS